MQLSEREVACPRKRCGRETRASMLAAGVTVEFRSSSREGVSGCTTWLEAWCSRLAGYCSSEHLTRSA